MKGFKFLVLSAVAIFFLFSAISIAAQKSKIPNAQDHGQNLGTPPPGGGGCKPTTCEEAGAYCGSISDGCGKVIHCGIAKQVSATVDLPQYTGVCPKTLKFTGTITTNKKGKVCYSFYNNYSFNSTGGSGQAGELVFDAAGTKQVFFDWAVPVNLPSNYQYILFAASGAGEVKVPFTMNCTKIFKPTGGNTAPQ